MKSKKNNKIHQARGKRKKRKKKSGDAESVASSDCDSDLKLNISHKRLKVNEINEANEASETHSQHEETNSQHEGTDGFNETIEHCLHEETNSQHKETDGFNETIEHCLIKFKETNNEVKPPEPTIKKKEKPPPFNYVLLNNVDQVKKFNKPAIDSFHDDIDNYNNKKILESINISGINTTILAFLQLSF